MRLAVGLFNGIQLSAWKRTGFSIIRWMVLLTFIASLLGPLSIARAQSEVPPTKVQGVLASMTPEERVGQLFLVTFQGINTDSASQIYDLIANHHVGGVVLLRENDNFVAAPDTIPAAHKLVSDLQSIEAQVSIPTPTPDSNLPTEDKIYVPLFVGISQEGDGVPHDQILSGLTPLPDAMAIGATWRTDMAQQIGEVLGSELSALGFNLFLGPSLDVVESPNPSVQIDLSTRSFGGDPFWVGEMGKAYVAGLHQGSNSRMVVVAKHFPGSGSSDRPPEEEVSTVRKSLEQLKQIELPPFFSVTNATDPASLVDGLLVSHIRYQGFQGNIRATTRPVSLDASALSAILALPEFTKWRTDGGLVVSDALGSQAVRDFYAQSGENFSPRVVARDAFVAGNDLLYLGNIASSDQEEDAYTATLRILEFFTQEYKNDPTFAQRVDAAVTRILTQKFRMYDLFTTSNVLTPDSGLANIGTSQQVMFDVARSAATLISPDPQELSTLLPTSPNQNDRIVFLTDTSSYQQCSGCAPQEAFGTFAFQDTVERLYGPAGSAQIFSSRLNSFPLTELELMLNGESQENIEPSLERANWIVISLADVSKGQIALLRRFFAERSNLIRDKKVILFSFTAPYYLDATDISKLTAYYALYSKQPAFIDVAARVLFQQIIPLQGSSPVSIPLLGYDLIIATSPDPNQVIPLALDEGEISLTPTVETTSATAEPTTIPLYRIGGTISVRAGPIFDHNNHLVPDGTPVRFTMSTRDESGGILVESTTTAGMARASFVIDKAGEVQIRAASEPARESLVLQFDASNEGSAVTVVVPTVSMTPVIIVPTVNTPVPENDLVSADGHPRIGVWLISLLALFGGALLAYWAVSRIVTPRWGLRWALCIFLGGLLGYNYLALDFPGAATWIASGGGALGVLLLIFAGETVGMLGAWAWMRWADLTNQRREQTD